MNGIFFCRNLKKKNLTIFKSNWNIYWHPLLYSAKQASQFVLVLTQAIAAYKTHHDKYTKKQGNLWLSWALINEPVFVYNVYRNFHLSRTPRKLWIIKSFLPFLSFLPSFLSFKLPMQRKKHFYHLSFFLLLQTKLKILAMGKKFLNHKIEVNFHYDISLNIMKLLFVPFELKRSDST